ncbi:MerR family transcriptional regulator [Actinomadura fibrosa]|uniref:MerR family transcriptional regulator n=1 Tax=Actinomadura fibrosa TaxID=111802 RepID=A0ABW2XKL6_9ACTN|nr:MerR family transcriptional regulator [Actinomadura fibrosa]
MDDAWTITELAERAVAALAAGESVQVNGRVRDVPNERLIRWYTTIGLVDPPLGRRGRTALYGPRHLLQLVAVKRRQAAGRSIAEIQIELAAATDTTLEQIAALPPETTPSRDATPPTQDTPPRDVTLPARAKPLRKDAPPTKAAPSQDGTPPAEATPPRDDALPTQTTSLRNDAPPEEPALDGAPPAETAASRDDAPPTQGAPSRGGALPAEVASSQGRARSPRAGVPQDVTRAAAKAPQQHDSATETPTQRPFWAARPDVSYGPAASSVDYKPGDSAIGHGAIETEPSGSGAGHGAIEDEASDFGAGLGAAETEPGHSSAGHGVTGAETDRHTAQVGADFAGGRPDIVQGVRLAPDLTLLVEVPSLSADDLAAIKAAARPLLHELRRRGLAAAPDDLVALPAAHPRRSQ